MLPEDFRYLTKALNNLHIDDQRKIAYEYYNAWINAMEECTIPSMSQNYGRKRANEYIGDVFKKK